MVKRLERNWLQLKKNKEKNKNALFATNSELNEFQMESGNATNATKNLHQTPII